MRRNYNVSQYYAAVKKRRHVSEGMIFVAIPLTIMAGVYFGKSRNYMMVSIILLIYTLLPFLMVFEKRKPKARELVLISIVAALAVFANLLCAYTVPVHAGTAIIIISGIALGPEAGFLVGAVSRFVCNFFTGQGPWTPWEMASWGIIGFVAGMTFNKIDVDKIASFSFSSEKEKLSNPSIKSKSGKVSVSSKKAGDSIKSLLGPLTGILVAMIVAYLVYMIRGDQGETFFGWRLYAYGITGLVMGIILQKKKLPVDNITVPVFTFLIVFIIYGGIMNIAALIMSNAISGEVYQINLSSLKLLYITGVPYDALHALGAAICNFIFGESMIRKIERIRIKYGVYQ